MIALSVIILCWPMIAFVGWLLTPGICDWRLRLAVRILLAIPCLVWVWLFVCAMVFGGRF